MFDEVAAGSIVAKYNGDDIVAGNSLDPNDITAILNYEDGSSYELDVIHQATFYIDSVSIDIENYVFESVGKITIKVVSEEKETTFNVNVKGFSVVFNANGGSGDDIIVPDIYGDYVLPSCTFTAPSEQKDFAGWKIKGQDGLLAVGSHVNITENIEIIAQWIESNPQSLSATYSGGNIVRGNTINGAYINIKLTYANSTYINVNPLDVEYWIGNSHINDPANYTFNVAQEYSITVKYSGLEATMVVNVVPKQFIVTFAAGEGSGSMAPVTHDEGDYPLPACTFTAPAGKTFDGWQVGGEKKLANEVIQLTENITITALWKDVPAVTYTVHFDANGGTGTMADVPGQSGDYALPQCDFVAPANKEFKCWSVGGVEKNPGDIIQVTSDVTVTALWKDVTPEPVKELTTITLSGTYKTEFEVGDNFSAEGLVVTAHYSDDSSEPIDLNNVEISGYNMNQEGKQTITVSYQGKTVTYEITVKAKDTPVTPDDPVTPNKSSGLPAGAVVGIVIGSAVVVGIGGFALVWFVIKKKTWVDFIALFKKK